MEEEEKAYDLFFKMLLVGDSGVGKSCLLLRFTDEYFTPSYITTIGIDFKIRTLQIEGKRVRLQIWDTAGQERFRTITSAYYRGAQGIMLLYDVTNETTFHNIRNWVRNIEQHACENVIKQLVACKIDLADQRVIERERGQELADEYGISYSEVSAKTGDQVDETFLMLAKQVYKQRRAPEAQQTDSSVLQLGNKESSKNKKCC